MDAQEPVGGREVFRECLNEACVKGGFRGKTMTNDIAIRDDMKAVERWENEGGKVPSLNRLWTSLKSFRTEDDSRERQVIDSQKSFGHQTEIFRGLTYGGWSSETSQ